MRSLWFLVALMIVDIASSVGESLELNKRILGGKGGLLGSILGSIEKLLNDLLGGILTPVDEVLEILAKALGGKPSNDLYDDLKRLPESRLCIACDDLTIAEQIYSCHQYCQELIKKAKQ